MRVFCATLIIASLAGAAYAQEDDHVQRYGEKPREKTQMEINADKAAARAYQNSLKNIPDQGPVDPWGNSRSVETPKAAAKPVAKPKAASAKVTKTGETAN